MTSPAAGDLVIFGTGAHARKAAQAWQAQGGRVTAFVDERAGAAAPVAGVPVLHAPRLGPPGGGRLFVAIGDVAARVRLMAACERQGWSLPPLVHPSASVAPDAVLEAGAMVAAGAVVEGGAVVGRGAIVDIGVLVDHDCRIDAFHHLKPGQVCPAGSTWPAVRQEP